MGLLDSILGSVISNATGGGGRAGGMGQAGPGGLDLGAILGSLGGLGGGAPSAGFGRQAPAQAGGGMGGIGALLAGPLGAALLQAVMGMLANRGAGAQAGGLGGLDGLRSRFDANGLGDVMNSWIASGENQPISPSQVTQVLGADQIDDLASRFGLSTHDVSSAVAQLMPEVVDRLTPQGQAPAQGFGGIEDVLGQLLGARR